VNWFIRLLTKYYRYVGIHNSRKETSLRRYFLLYRERFDDAGQVSTRWKWQNKLPNVFINNWHDGDDYALHSHPSYTITIVLRGWFVEELVEPFHAGRQSLMRSKGDIIFRKYSTFHRFIIPNSQRGKIWTIFIRWPWKYRQYYLDNKTCEITGHHDFVEGVKIWDPIITKTA
jgi:hypothetical protein